MIGRTYDFIFDLECKIAELSRLNWWDPFFGFKANKCVESIMHWTEIDPDRAEPYMIEFRRRFIGADGQPVRWEAMPGDQAVVPPVVARP